ncbi:aminotransferase class V-fold PLP-dependent enzyme [Streptomyces sp. NPDC004311]|uniref:aminotransferase class V-fold PLP-dependent enzyme n=1 Tax=Streptomyces sp. NPDC004311 TaxID=3364698 RepID=UPI0036A65FC4
MDAPTRTAPHRPAPPTVRLDTARTAPTPHTAAEPAHHTTAHDHHHTTATPHHPTADEDPHTRARTHLGRLWGVPATHTHLTTGADDTFDTLVRDTPLTPRDRIWTTPHESVARLHTLHTLRDRTRCRLEVVPLRPDGDLDLDWMRHHLDDDVALVSVTHLSPACGTVNPVTAIGRLLAPHRARYALDASHSAGLLPLDAAATGCHLLTADAFRFLNGPPDTGIAYTHPHPDAPAGSTPPPAPHPAAVTALADTLTHHTRAATHPHTDHLPRLRAALARTPGITLLPTGTRQAGILAFRHDHLDAGTLRHALARRAVLLSKTVAHEHPLHPASRTGAPALHASLHPATTAHDIDRLAHTLTEVLHAHTHPTPHPRTPPTTPALPTPRTTPARPATPTPAPVRTLPTPRTPAHSTPATPAPRSTPALRSVPAPAAALPAFPALPGSAVPGSAGPGTRTAPSLAAVPALATPTTQATPTTPATPTAPAASGGHRPRTPAPAARRTRTAGRRGHLTLHRADHETTPHPPPGGQR